MASQCDTKDDIGRFRYLEAYKDIDIVKKHLEAILYNGQLTKQEKTQMKKKKFIPTF